MMIFIPVSRSTATELLQTAGPTQPLVGYAATPALCGRLGFDSSLSDEASFETQTYAMVAGLIRALWPDGNRLVLAAEVPDRVVHDNADMPPGWGSVRLAEFAWPWVSAVFSDGTAPEPGVAVAVQVAAARVDGDELSAALGRPEVQGLIDEHDLLWHLPDEPW